MSTVSWVHISDIHYSKKNEPQIKLILPSLLEALQHRHSITDDKNLAAENPLLFVTGDLTFSGSKQELSKSFDLVIDPICKKIDVSLNRLFLCPGNHEIMRLKSQIEIIRPYLLKEENNVSILFNKKHTLYKQVTQAFSPYKSFHNSLFPKRNLLDPGLFYVEDLTDLPFSIVSLNTAWAGLGGDSDRAKLFIGTNQVTDSFSLVPSSNSIITITHHPLTSVDTGWFADFLDTHSSQTTIMNRSSFVFSGHIHKPNAISMEDIHGSLGISLAGAFCTDEWHPYRPLSFTTGWINTDNNTFKLYIFVYLPIKQKWECIHESKIHYYRTPSSAVSLKDKIDISTNEHEPSLTVRSQDYNFLKKSLSSSGDSIRVLWIKGFPGIGKTTFAFSLSNILFKGKTPIYIRRGVENDTKAIVSAIQNHSPSKWFEVWKKHGKAPIDNITHEDLIEIISHIMNTSDIWFIIEAGESYNENEKSFFYKLMNTVIASNSGIRTIVTTRESPKGISQPPHFTYELDRFLLSDTIYLISERTKCSNKFKEEIHNRFHGHPMSICSFIAQITKLELDEKDENEMINVLKKIPFRTIDLLESLWSNISDTGKRVISAISDIPELGVKDVVSICKNSELEKSGILSTYPSSLPNNVRFYVHPLVKEVCCPLLKISERQKAKYEAVKAAYSSGLLGFGPLLIKIAIEAGVIDHCSDLIQTDGRAWIEISGIKESAKAFDSFLNFDKYHIYSLYLKGLCHLFAGEYTDAESCFRHLLSLPSLSDTFTLAIRAEVMECYRRQGKIFEAFSELVELFPKWKSQTHISNDCNLNFSGVCGFLIAHLMRTLGAYEKSAEIYAVAEKSFMNSKSISNIIERLHCQYARSLALQTSSFVTSIDLRHDFARSPVKSDFLLGLASYLFAASQIREGNYSKAIETLYTARFHFQKFCSLAYDCRMLCMLGITSIFLKDFHKATEYFLEVVTLSENNSPQYYVSNALIDAINSKTDNSYAVILNSLSNLLKRGKLATTATLLSTYFAISNNNSNFIASKLNTSIYLLDTSGRNLSTKRLHLSTVKDTIDILLSHLKITTISQSFPIIE
ncbi:MAG: metallophosphoesterase [Candidatus Scalindua sp.]|nr:metallophosphoesterase [Candidatus Scalindua sp.]MCR4343418.1 metallophosphoesterase [Candidatus Scalindua sp.]